MDWQLIDTAPKDGTKILCGWVGRKSDYAPIELLIWKTNPRITPERFAHEPDISPSYFGDPLEMDDYDLARPGGGPTHWLPVPPLPD